MMRIAYADPPYPGMSSLYKDQSDYAGEVDHAALINRLSSEYDGWILHTSSTAISVIAPLLPAGVRWGAWVKSFASFKKGVRPASAWEPVIFKPCRRMDEDYTGRIVQRDWISCPITLRRGFIGAKPAAVCHWAFEVVGANKSDELVDLFPGSGAVSRAWESWASTTLAIRPGIWYSGRSRAESGWRPAFPALTHDMGLRVHDDCCR